MARLKVVLFNVCFSLLAMCLCVRAGVRACLSARAYLKTVVAITFDIVLYFKVYILAFEISTKV